MLRSLFSLLVVAFAAASLAACGEKPPRPVPDGEQSYNGVNQPNPMYERTLKQGESRRMDY
jgi:predicted small lipoprotein YifL